MLFGKKHQKIMQDKNERDIIRKKYFVLVEEGNKYCLGNYFDQLNFFTRNVYSDKEDYSVIEKYINENEISYITFWLNFCKWLIFAHSSYRNQYGNNSYYAEKELEPWRYIIWSLSKEWLLKRLEEIEKYLEYSLWKFVMIQDIYYVIPLKDWEILEQVKQEQKYQLYEQINLFNKTNNILEKEKVIWAIAKPILNFVYDKNEYIEKITDLININEIPNWRSKIQVIRHDDKDKVDKSNSFRKKYEKSNDKEKILFLEELLRFLIIFYSWLDLKGIM